MSGLVALFDRTGSGVDHDLGRTMLDRIDHRGPDGRGLWRDDCIALGHQQLHSTPESKYDQQPYRDDELVVVADARLDNRGELLARLPLPDSDQPVPDSHLLLAAYRKWGSRCVDHLIGAYAFVIWDMDDDTVFCARDHLGVKPLYYYQSDDVFAAASELKSLLTIPSVSKVADEEKIGEFLVGIFDDKERTYYRNLRRLAPAHTMTVRSDDTIQRQYWDLDPTRTISLNSDAAYERRFRELFDQAVECRLRTPGQIGTSLSGGLDSSSITVTARELISADDPLHTFSNVYNDAPSSDEREFIETVTEREGIIPHYVFMDEVGMFEDQKQMIQYYDVPPHDTMHHAIWERVKRADEASVDILLEGVFGDSAVGYGLGLLAELFRTGHWRQLFDELQALSDLVNVSTSHLFVQNVVVPLLPPALHRYCRKLRGKPILDEKKNPALDREFVRRSQIRAKLKERKTSFPFFRETDRHRQRRSLLSGLLTVSLEVSDLVYSAFGIEPRYPFADKRLVEFSLAMPPTQHLSNGWTRSIIRRSLSDRLPEEIRTRPWKTDLSRGFWNSLSHENEEIKRQIANPGLLQEFFEISELQECYNRFSERKNTRDARTLWRALSLSLWSEAYEVNMWD